MNAEHVPHPSREQLAAFDAGQLTPAERESIERHLAACPLCGRELDTLPEDPFVALVRASAGSHAVSNPDTPAGAGGGQATPAPTDVPAALLHHPRYRVLEVLGAGGMGVVYKAVHRVMDRVVALKVLHRRFTEHLDFVERFRREAQALALLAHPHIAVGHDAEQAGDLHFLVMEYVPGLSLDRVVAQRGPLPVAEACAYIQQAALGLQHAFEHGLVHRDVKPANLMRMPAGQVKVLDFGLAQLARESGEDVTTTPGAFLGTPDYTAPEQARDPHSADIRADVYGLGATLRFLLTAHPLFPGGTTLQKLLAHQDRLPSPVSQFRDDVPVPLLALLERMLSKDPARRPATPADVARALAPFAGDMAEPNEVEQAAQPVRRRRWAWLVATVALLVAAGVISVVVWSGWHRQRPPADSPQPAESAVAAPVDPLALANAEQMVRLRNERRDQALAWLRDNGRKGRQNALVRDTAAQFAKYPGQIDGFQIVLGSQWIEARQAVLLAGHHGGFFVFPLSAEQSNVLGIKDGTRLIRSSRNINDLRRAAPRLGLSELKFDEGQRLNLNKPVSGSIAYEVHGPAVPSPFAIRLAVYLDGAKRRSVLQWFKGQTLEGRGMLKFVCPPLASSDFQPRGPVVLFADFCTDVDSQLLVESDTVAAFVEAVAPAKPLQP